MMTYESKNSSSLLRSVQVGAFGSLATASASLRASRSRWCASLRRRASHRLCDSSKVSSMSEPQVGMCAGSDKRKNQYIFLYRIEKHPVVLDVAVPHPGFVTDQGMVFALGWKRSSVGQHQDNFHQFRTVESAPRKKLQVFLELRGLLDQVFHENKNSSSFAGSSQEGQFGSCAIRLASSNAARVSSRGVRCLRRPSLKGISPTARHFLRKQVMPVVMFMPISSKNSSASAFSSLSTRMVIADVIVSVLSVRKNDGIVLKSAYYVNGSMRSCKKQTNGYVYINTKFPKRAEDNE